MPSAGSSKLHGLVHALGIVRIVGYHAFVMSAINAVIVPFVAFSAG